MKKFSQQHRATFSKKKSKKAVPDTVVCRQMMERSRPKLSRSFVVWAYMMSGYGYSVEGP